MFVDVYSATTDHGAGDDQQTQFSTERQQRRCSVGYDVNIAQLCNVCHPCGTIHPEIASLQYRRSGQDRSISAYFLQKWTAFRTRRYRVWKKRKYVSKVVENSRSHRQETQLNSLAWVQNCTLSRMHCKCVKSWFNSVSLYWFRSAKLNYYRPLLAVLVQVRLYTESLRKELPQRILYTVKLIINTPTLIRTWASEPTVSIRARRIFERPSVYLNIGLKAPVYVMMSSIPYVNIYSFVIID